MKITSGVIPRINLFKKKNMKNVKTFSPKQKTLEIGQSKRSVRTAVMDELINEDAFDENCYSGKTGFAWVGN